MAPPPASENGRIGQPCRRPCRHVEAVQILSSTDARVEDQAGMMIAGARR